MKNPVSLVLDESKTSAFILRGIWKVKAKQAGWTPEEVAAFDATLNGLNVRDVIARMRPFAVNNGTALPEPVDPPDTGGSAWGFDADDSDDDDDEDFGFDDDDEDEDAPKKKVKSTGGASSAGNFDFDNWFQGDDD